MGVREKREGCEGHRRGEGQRAEKEGGGWGCQAGRGPSPFAVQGKVGQLLLPPPAGGRGQEQQVAGEEGRRGDGRGSLPACARGGDPRALRPGSALLRATAPAPSLPPRPGLGLSSQPAPPRPSQAPPGPCLPGTWAWAHELGNRAGTGAGGTARAGRGHWTAAAQGEGRARRRREGARRTRAWLAAPCPAPTQPEEPAGVAGDRGAGCSQRRKRASVCHRVSLCASVCGLCLGDSS